MNAVLESLQVLYPEQEQIHINEVLTLVSSLVSSQTQRMVDARGFISLRISENQKTTIKKANLKKPTSSQQKPTQSQSQTPVQQIPVISPDFTKTALKVKVTLIAFTGMDLGIYEACIDNNFIHLYTNSNKLLSFDSQTLKQVNPKNPKFANRIKLS